MKSKEPLSQQVATRLLLDNMRMMLGSFELSQDDEGVYKLSYSASMEADCSPESLKEALQIVLFCADVTEKDLTGKDEF